MNERNNHAAEIVLGVPKETPNTISDFRSRGLPSNRCRVQLKALGKHKFGSKLRVFVLPSLYSPKNPTVESTIGGGGGGLPGAGMRLEAVRAVDGLADSRETEEAVGHAVGIADGEGGRPRRRLIRRPGRTPVGTAASVRRAVVLVNGRLGNTTVRQAVGYADGRADGLRTATRTGGHTSTGRNGHPQHRETKPPPSAGRSGFYLGVKLTKSGF